MKMKKFSRTELYNELLTSTLKDLSEKYHVSYHKFSAFCHQNNIPIPGSKYRMYLKMDKEEYKIHIDNNFMVKISGNNVDGIIITTKRMI